MHIVVTGGTGSLVGPCGTRVPRWPRGRSDETCERSPQLLGPSVTTVEWNGGRRNVGGV